MSKDPAFLFYSSDFLTGTAFMTNDQVGKYIRLLCLQHQHGHLKDLHMKSICSTYDELIYSKFAQDEGGNYYNIRLEEEVTKRIKYTESRRNNVLSRYKQKEKPKSTYVLHMENENENENINKNEDINKEYIFFENLNFKELWESFLEMRKSVKSRPTERAKDLLLKKLHSWPLDIACESLRISIENNWKGVFKPKMDTNKNHDWKEQFLKETGGGQ